MELLGDRGRQQRRRHRAGPSQGEGGHLAAPLIPPPQEGLDALVRARFLGLRPLDIVPRPPGEGGRLDGVCRRCGHAVDTAVDTRFLASPRGFFCSVSTKPLCPPFSGSAEKTETRCIDDDGRWASMCPWHQFALKTPSCCGHVDTNSIYGFSTRFSPCPQVCPPCVHVPTTHHR